MADEENIEELLDDDDIRNFFQSRDPNRAKPIPFLDEETAEKFKGKATVLTPKEVPEKNESYGVSFTQHVKSIKEAARHYFWIGMSIGLAFAIIITLIT